MVKREFETWATRNSDVWKLEFSKYVHPLNEFNFAQYMKSHQFIDGEYREGDNWTKGIPFNSLFESAYRHMQALWLMYNGYTVNETNKDWEFDWVLGTIDPEKAKEMWITYHTKNYVEQINAIRFNLEAMKLQLLTGNIINEEPRTEQDLQGREEDTSKTTTTRKKDKKGTSQL